MIPSRYSRSRNGRRLIRENSIEALEILGQIFAEVLTKNPLNYIKIHINRALGHLGKVLAADLESHVAHQQSLKFMPSRLHGQHTQQLLPRT
jgi:hypothetical protein